MFLFQFRNYFKYIWQRCANAPSANLKKKRLQEDVLKINPPSVQLSCGAM